MKTAQMRNVVGEFADSRSARAAVRFLEHAGFKADEVSVIKDNVRQAREVTGSRSIPGAIVGTLIALLLFVTFLVFGPPEMRTNPVALVLGFIALLPAGIGIGVLAGRSRLFVARHADRVEDAIDEGETLVTVHVEEREHDRARSLLREAGAVAVREEETIEGA